MQDARGVKRAERADRIEARQCVSCHRWFTRRARHPSNREFDRGWGLGEILESRSSQSISISTAPDQNGSHPQRGPGN